jgi:hypothetical protein
MFNLIRDSWIPTNKGLMPLGDWRSINQVIAPPMSRLAIVRLLVAIEAWERQGNQLSDYSDWFDLSRAFQVTGLPADSAKSPSAIVLMEDGNGIALRPLPHAPVTDAELALGLVTAYFCDRGGLKTRVPGLPISAQTPHCVGRRIKLRRGDNFAALIEANRIEYSGESIAIWADGQPTSDTPIDHLELLLWPWRRLQIHGDGITIAPGLPMAKDVPDPWAIDKAALRHQSEPRDAEFEITALVMNQATPVACWIA